jgi:hypothetical protein
MAAGMTSLSWHQVDFQMPVGETVERLRHLLPQLAEPVVNRPATSTVRSSCCCYSCAAMKIYHYCIFISNIVDLDYKSHMSI